MPTILQSLARLSFVLCVFLLSGCATTSLRQEFEVNSKEAKEIAYKEFVKSDYRAGVNTKHPKVYDDTKIDRKNKRICDLLSGFDVFGEDGKSKFKESWFVLYRESGLFRLGNLVLIVVDKNNGQVMYSHFYCPLGILMSTPEGREMLWSGVKELKGT